MNYRELERYIQDGRSDAFITIHWEYGRGDWIEYVISVSQDQAGLRQKEYGTFSINLQSGDFKLDGLDLIGKYFGIDRKKFILDYVSRSPEEWKNSIDEAKIAVITADPMGNMVVAKKIIDKSENSHFNFLKNEFNEKPKIEYGILPADTDLASLPNNYYFDDSETLGLSDIVRNSNEEFGKANGDYSPKDYMHYKTVYFSKENGNG